MFGRVSPKVNDGIHHDPRARPFHSSTAIGSSRMLGLQRHSFSENIEKEQNTKYIKFLASLYITSANMANAATFL
jgi:hypothetical protein